MKTNNYYIAICAVCFAIGFFFGRKTSTEREVVRYVKGETIIADYPTHLLLPSKEIKANITTLPTWFILRDTVEIDNIEYIVEKVDTTAIIEDFITERKYSLVLFDNNKQGKLDLSTTVQFNKLASLSYSYTPISKEITKINRRTIEPFASATYNTFQTAGIGGGIFYKNTGLEYKYLHNMTTGATGHEAGLLIKF